MNIDLQYIVRWSLRILLLCLLAMFQQDILAQTTIRGYVQNDSTQAYISGVVILVNNTNHSTSTDERGFYEISFEDSASILTFLHEDYDTEVVRFTPGYDQELNVKMSSEFLYSELEEVVITNKKVKYSNKDNPAVELIRKVVAQKDENRMTASDYLRYNRYDKLHLSASNIPKFVHNNFLLRPLDFIFQNIDTISRPGLKLMPVFIQERWSRNYYSKSNNAKKQIIVDEKVISLDPKLINEEATVSKVNFLFDDFDIYDNNLRIMTNNFLSPIASSGPTFYKYYIVDTIIENGKRLVELSFEPRNTTDLLLRGSLIIDIDQNHAVAAAEFTISKFTNLNFVKDLNIEVKYQANDQQKYVLSRIKNQAFFTLIRSGKIGEIGIWGHRTSKYLDLEYPINIPADSFKTPTLEIPENIVKQSNDYYEAIRPEPLSFYEARAYHLEDSMKQLPYFKRLLQWSAVLISGYKTVGKIDIGPYFNLLGYNPVEGLRFKLGIRTNPIANKRYYARSYLAYGMKDKTWKHLLELRYSIKHKRIYDYPMHYFTLSSQYDSKVPGRIYETNVNDNLVGSIQRGSNDKFIYTHTLRGAYVFELPKNVLITLDAAYLQQTPQGSLYFSKYTDGVSDTLQHITSNAFGLQLRWSPGERYFFDRVQRSRLPTTSPIFLLRAEYGIKDIFHSDYNYQKYSIEIEKRTNLGFLGLLDATVKANVIYGDLPYPLLNIPRANQSYTYSNGSYNLMNYGEFVSDRQVELALNYRMYGFILNKIPLIKRLELREIFGFKMIYGSLSDKNNPLFNPQAMHFPRDNHGNAYVHTFTSEPYMEWSVGISNIFKILRVDYIQRLNYLNHVNAPRHGIRVGVLFDL